MDWTTFLIGLGLLALGYWCYRNVKGKSWIDEDNLPTYKYGRDWIWAIFGTVGGTILMLTSIPADVSIPIALLLALGFIFFLLRWLYRAVRRLLKKEGTRDT